MTTEKTQIETAKELEQALKTSNKAVYRNNTAVAFRLRLPEKGRNRAYYVFEIPKRLSGKRVVKQSTSPAKLLILLEKELDKLGNRGATQKEQAEFLHYLEDLRELKARGVQLSDLLKHFDNTFVSKEHRKRLSELQAELLKLKESRNPSKDTLRSMERHGRRIIHDFGDCHADEIDLDGAYNWCMTATNLSGKDKGKPWSGKTRQHNWNWLNELLDYAASEDCISGNPLRSIYKEKLASLYANESKAPEILTPAQTEEYLHVLWKRKPELLPMVVLNLFAGVRLHESMNLEWKDLRLKMTELHVSEKVAKTRQTRYVKLNETVQAWLKVCLDHRHKSESENERLGRYSADSIEDRLAYLRKHHLSFDWPQNAPRHSYASHTLVLHGEQYTKQQLGHSYSSDMLFKHYRAAVDEETAKAYFNITPDTLARAGKKIISFPKAS